MERRRNPLKKLITETKKIFSIDGKLSSTKGNLVCDAVPDPPRVSEDDYGAKNIELLNEPQKNKSPAKDVNNENNETPDESSDKSEASSPDDSEQRKRDKNQDERPEQTKSPNVKNITLNHCNDVKITSNRLYNFNIQNQPRKEKEERYSRRKMPPYMETLKASEFEISQKDMDLVKLHIGKRWRSTAKFLGYSDGQIEQHEEMHEKYGFGEIFYQILMDWKQSKTKDATIGHLVEALWCSEEDDCLDKLAMMHLQVKKA